MRLAASFTPVCLLSLLALAGCSASFAPSPAVAPGKSLIGSISGKVYGGQQPITGAHIYVFAAGTGGYGTASTSLITDTTNPDTTTLPGQTIYYETTDSNGFFQLGGDYTCTQGTQVYLYSLSGNPGLSSNNTLAGLLAGLGQCPASGTLASQVPSVVMNEVSTIAFAYAMGGFATDAVHVSSSGTTLAQTGIANAMANIPNILSVQYGQALTTTASGSGGTVPQSKMYALADVLAACINSAGYTTGPGDGTACGTLFKYETSSGTATACTTPPCGAGVATDTATAAIYMARNPWNANSTVFNLSKTTPPFGTQDTSETDFSLQIDYPAAYDDGGDGVASDNAGNVYVSSFDLSLVQKYSHLGARTTLSGGGLTNANGMAVDSSGNLWVASNGSNALVEFSPGGAVLSGTNGYSVGGHLTFPAGLAFDGSGNMWIPNSTATGSLVEANASAGYTKTLTGGGLVYPQFPSIDSSGNIWMVANNDSSHNLLSEFTSSAAVGTGYTIPNAMDTYTTAVDSSGNVWLSGGSGECVGKLLAGATPSTYTAHCYTGGGLNSSAFVAIDGAGNVFATGATPVLSEFTNSGTPLTTSSGYAFTGATQGYGVDVVDISGNVWAASVTAMQEFLGMAAPTAQPLTPATAGTKP